MAHFKVEDLSIGEVQKTRYQASLWGCGFEQRCTYLLSLVSDDQIGHQRAFGFQVPVKSQGRLAAEEYFASRSVLIREFGGADDASIFQTLNELPIDLHDSIHLLVDYSSMTRTWYASILRWACLANTTKVTIDFCYSTGRYPADIPPTQITDVLCIPGCEGSGSSQKSSIAVFGLGFEPWPPLCVIDKLEPNDVYAVIADPGASEGDVARALLINDEFIRQNAPNNIVRLPLRSVASTYYGLLELIDPFLGNAKTSLIFLGPKPHVLASILVAMSASDVACLHVSGLRNDEVNVEATGEMVVTRVTVYPRTVMP